MKIRKIIDSILILMGLSIIFASTFGGFVMFVLIMSGTMRKLIEMVA